MPFTAGDILGILTGGLLGNVVLPFDYFTDGWFEFTSGDVVISPSTIDLTGIVVNPNLNISYVESISITTLNFTLNDNSVYGSAIILPNPIDNTLYVINPIIGEGYGIINSISGINLDSIINNPTIIQGQGNTETISTINFATSIIDPSIAGNALIDLDIIEIGTSLPSMSASVGQGNIESANALTMTLDTLNPSILLSSILYPNPVDLNLVIYEPDIFVNGGIIVYINTLNLTTYTVPNGLQVIMKLDGPGNFTHIYNISNSGTDISNILSAVPNSVLLSGTINDLNYIETVYHVSGTELDLIVPPYEKIHTSLFGDFATGYGMGNGTNMVNGWITKCDDSQFYNNERKLFDNLITEAYNLHGVCMDYYITSYNKNYDKVWGEDNNRFFERKFPVNVYYMLPREEKMWSKFGIQGVDTFSMYISKLHFRDTSTIGMNEVAGDIGQGTYNSYIPQIGDIIRSEYNNYIYEITEVKEEIGMFLLSKQHIWELIVKTYKDEHISLSATTSAGMAEISAVTNKSSDMFNISSVIDTKKVPIKYVSKNFEKPSNDPYAGW